MARFVSSKEETELLLIQKEHIAWILLSWVTDADNATSLGPNTIGGLLSGSAPFQSRAFQKD